MKPDPAPDPTPDPTPGPAPRGAVTDLDVDVLMSDAAWAQHCADPGALCRRAAQAGFDMALADGIELPGTRVEVSVVLSDDDRVHELNRDYRGIDKATNVLSFTTLEDESEGHHPIDAPVLLGDIIVAFQTVEGEAKLEGKTLDAHLSHMVVHGILHLMGYDHETDGDADEMEALETQALAHLGVADPYARPLQPSMSTGNVKGKHNE